MILNALLIIFIPDTNRVNVCSLYVLIISDSGFVDVKYRKVYFIKYACFKHNVFSRKTNLEPAGSSN